MDTKFYLRKQKGKKEAFIYFSLKNVDGEDYKYSTKEKIDIKNWSTGYPKRNQSTMAIRNIIDGYKAVIDDFIKDYIKKEKRQPTKEEFSMFVDMLINGRANQHKKSIEDYVEEYLGDHTLGISEKTIRVKKIHLDHFLNFIGRKNRLADINQTKLQKYDNHLKGQSRRQLVTVNNYLKNLKAFLNWLEKKNYIDIDLKKFIIRLPEVEKDVIALTNEEYMILEKATFEKENYQEQVDIFLISCYTSLSISDLKKINKDYIDKNDFTTIRRTKNNNDQRIRFIHNAIRILEKYDYKLPFISDNKGCGILKEAFKELKMNRLVRITNETPHGIVTDEYKKLHEVISWHKGRKTAISTMIQNGVPLQVIMEISGHRKESTVKKYKAVESKVIHNTMDNIRPQSR
jgi:site-specific recombinase XerD